MMLNILAVNLGVTFLRIQCVNLDLLVLRPSIDSSRIRTNDSLVTRVLDDVDVILDENYNYMDLAYLLIHGSLGASVYHQLGNGVISFKILSVRSQLVVGVVLDAVWLYSICCVTKITLNLRIKQLVLLEVLLYRIISFREGGLKYLCIPQLHILCNFFELNLARQ